VTVGRPTTAAAVGLVKATRSSKCSRTRSTASLFQSDAHCSAKACASLRVIAVPRVRLTRIRRQFVVYFCLHGGKCARKHGNLASRQRTENCHLSQTRVASNPAQSSARRYVLQQSVEEISLKISFAIESLSRCKRCRQAASVFSRHTAKVL